MKRPIVTFFILIFFTINIAAQTVERALQEAGRNRKELEKAINYFVQTKDAEKIKAVKFLIANMDIHTTSDFYWADKLNRKINFNELAFPDFASSVKAFEEIAKNIPGIHPVTVKYRDVDVINSAFIIDNVEQAFKSWDRSSNSISFENFCEFVLPYRISVEPLQQWRKVYHERFLQVLRNPNNKNLIETVKLLAADNKKWFTNTYKVEQRKEPIARLSALQLLFRKKGPCEDIADLQVFALRSQGIPASIDEVPWWAASSGKHFLNVGFTDKMKPVSFDVSTELVYLDKIAREPGKVIRTTYSRQAGTLANTHDPKSIPDGFLRRLNYIDVTDQYWPTTIVNCPLYSSTANGNISYACVFNFFDWRPVWWGEIKDRSVSYNNMGKGSVFLPMEFVNSKLIPAGYPVAVGYNNTAILKPDLTNRRTINLTEQAGYLVFRKNKAYRLFYWDRSWKLVGERRADQSLTALEFVNVPTNALLLLVPEYTEHKERPFIITNNNQRIWF
jgi:hypothetical protein